MKGSELIQEKELKDGVYNGMLGETEISPRDMITLSELEFSPEEVAEMMAIDELRDPAPIEVSSVLTDEEIIEAAKASHSYGFIKRLPNGFDTVIGEDGGSLSQGQKQLLCITRIMLTRPPMLILDEATSSIDTRTEIKIQKRGRLNDVRK